MGRLTETVGNIFRDFTGFFPNTELPSCDLQEKVFIETSKFDLYYRIVFSVISEVMADDKVLNSIYRTFADSHSPKTHGLAYWVAKAMAEKRRIVLKKTKITMPTTYFTFELASSISEEYPQDYIEIDFTGYRQSELVGFDYALMFEAIKGAFRGVKISQGLLFKINDLSKAMNDNGWRKSIEAQLSQVDSSIKEGRAAYLDGGSDAKFIDFDVDPTKKAVEFSYHLLSQHTGYPSSWFNGEGGSALSDTGDSDRQQIRRANAVYFLSVVLPLLEQLYSETFTLKPDIDNASMLPTLLPTIEQSDMLTQEGREKILFAVFGLGDEDIQEPPKQLPMPPRVDKVNVGENE